MTDEETIMIQRQKERIKIHDEQVEKGNHSTLSLPFTWSDEQGCWLDSLGGRFAYKEVTKQFVSLEQHQEKQTLIQKIKTWVASIRTRP